MGRSLRSKLMVVLAVVALQAVAVLVYLRVERSRDERDAAFVVEHVTPRAAPDLTWTNLDGTNGRIADARGTTVLLHFWATWCPPCKEELPGLLALGRELARDGAVRVIAVSLDDDWAAVGEFFAGDVPPEVVLGVAKTVAETYGVSTLPDTYVVGPEGLLRLRVAGERDWRSMGARAAVRGIIGRP